jgi:hypothetical protein
MKRNVSASAGEKDSPSCAAVRDSLPTLVTVLRAQLVGVEAVREEKRFQVKLDRMVVEEIERGLFVACPEPPLLQVLRRSRVRLLQV